MVKLMESNRLHNGDLSSIIYHSPLSLFRRSALGGIWKNLHSDGYPREYLSTTKRKQAVNRTERWWGKRGFLTIHCSRPRGKRDLQAMVLVWEFWKAIEGPSGAAELKTVRWPSNKQIDLYQSRKKNQGGDQWTHGELTGNICCFSVQSSYLISSSRSSLYFFSLDHSVLGSCHIIS